jgi:hypothetical protein
MSEPDFDETDGEYVHPPKEELAIWLSEFMAASADADLRYRQHYCDLMATRIYEEFGTEGFCEMMMSMDKQANWISDIILENSDIDDILFQKYGVYDKYSLVKARDSASMTELNQKMWRLRRKYAKIIADELMATTEDDEEE